MMAFGDTLVERNQRQQIKRMRVVLKSLTEFAWSSMQPDCPEAGRELTRRLDRARKALGDDI